MAQRTFEYRYFGSFRFGLALLVMAQHFIANVAPMRLTLAFRPVEIGYVAVLVFFALSGFVISEAVDVVYRGRPLAFFSNRLMRLFPHFIGAVLVSVAAQAALFAAGTLTRNRVHPLPDFGWVNLFFNLFDIIPGVETLCSYHFVEFAWAVRIEMVFYILVAGCLLLSRTTGVRVSRLLTVLAAALVFPLGVFFFGFGPVTVSFIPYFALGAGLYYAYLGNRTGGIIVGLSVVGVIVHFATQPSVHPSLHFHRNLAVELALVLILLGAFAVLARVKRAPFRKADQYLGTITYPLYLYHEAISTVFSSLFRDSLAALFTGMVASVAFAIMMAWLLDPIVDRYRDRLRGRSLPAARAEKRLSAAA